MKLAFFTKKEDYINWLENRIAAKTKAMENAALEADKAINGIGRKAFLEANMIEEGTQEADDAWNGHVTWRCDNWAHERRELRKLVKELKAAQQAS